MQWFLDAYGARRCVATGMRYEDVDVEQDGVWLERSRPSVPMPPPVHLRGPGTAGTEDGCEVRANVAPGHASAAQAVCKATGPALGSPLGSEDSMLVEKVLTSGGETSDGKIESYHVGLRSKVAHKESEMNRAGKRALQQQRNNSEVCRRLPFEDFCMIESRGWLPLPRRRSGIFL